MNDQQKRAFACRDRKRYGDWIVTVPNGPYNAAEHRRFISSLPSHAAYDHCVECVITGGNGCGYPGYFREEVLAVYQPKGEAE